MLTKDFSEFVELLNSNKVKYLVVGGYALALHGHPRFTKDLDIWVQVHPNNAKKLLRVLREFGFSALAIGEEDFLIAGNVIQLGYPPCRIDILTQATGVEFETCYAEKTQIELGEIWVDFINIDNLIKNKRAVGRLQDLADIEALQ